MASELRKTGISILGDLPWGRHFCHFYETKQDLLDTVVPYLKAGLDSKEFCLWMVSDSDLLTIEEAKTALAEAVPDFERHVMAGNIEILRGPDWYLEKEVFNSERVTAAWDTKLKQALARGFEGMRAAGDTFWLGETEWKNFLGYEKNFNDFITNRPLTVLCTYPLGKSGAAEVLDVVAAHQFATARRRGEWEVIGSAEPVEARTEIERLNRELQRTSERPSGQPLILSYGVTVLSVGAALVFTLWLRTQVGERTPIVALFLCAIMFSAWFGGAGPGLFAIMLALLAFVYYFATPYYSFAVDVTEIPRLLIFTLSALFVCSLSVAQRNKADSLRRARDVLDGTVDKLKQTNQALRTENAERKRAESSLFAREQEFRAIVENAPDQIIRYDKQYRRTYVNPAVAEFYGQPAETLIGKILGSGLRENGVTVSENEVKRVRDAVAAVFETGKLQEYEMTWTMPTGPNYFSIRLFPELDTNGSVVNVLGISRDVTQRKLAEEELKKEKEILEKIFANVPVMIGFVGEDGRVKLVNSEWERIIGWTLEELDQHNVDIFSEAYPDPQYRQEILDFVAAATGEWRDLKIRVRNGRVIDAACAVVQLSDGTKVAIAQDITERKRAEEALRRSEDRIRLIIDTIPVMAWSTQPDGVVDFLNQRWLDYAGLSLDQYVADPTGPIHPEDTSRVMEKWSAQMALGEEYNDEMRLRSADQEYRWFLVRTAPLRDESGKVIKWYGVSTDIDDRRRAEEALKESQRKLEASQRIAHVGHYEHDLDTDVMVMSEENYRILGIPPAKIMTLARTFELIHPDDRERLHRVRDEAVRLGQHFDVEYRVVRPDGEIRFIHSHGDVIRDEQGRARRMFGIAQDITERKRAEQQLRTTSEQLRALSASLQSAREEEGTRIAREIHDELGSTLTSLKWDLEELDKILASNDLSQLAELREKLQAMIDLTDTAVSVLRRIASELRPSVLDDLGLVAAIEWQAQQFQARTGIICDCSLENVELSEEQSTAVFRIFQEALTNVLRHAQATKVEITIKNVADSLILEISDNGKGIMEKDKAERQSLGILGMRERAHLIGAEVVIKGEEGKGTVVVVRVPSLSRSKGLKNAG